VFGGQSGSPVWEVISGVRYVRGIISYGQCSNFRKCRCCASSYKNFAMQMTTQRYNDALAWAAAM
jgi:hypothetical protein